ncbi:MAG TPA: preprotein translocase subunit SecY [Steroidobacteraceae bacterium]|nr:preprotein translocase subunit SecY [Steroidobacteraceae bacterium]HQW07941.1 preprotein translocase subunit SecY [Steroidobacteraceae bacterium]HQX79171.1 preprotein translocase subunit SecY [Steroidobacteraceae bacterium]
MATTTSNPTAGLGDAARVGEIRSRVLFLIGALIVYRIGTFIPVPGIDPGAVARFFDDKSSTILGIVNMFSGGALERLSIFAMGVMPYISASIIVQMMSMVLPSFMEIRKEGESGRRRLSQITRYGTLALGVVQSFAAAMALQNGGMALGGGGWQFLFTATVTMTTGTMFLMWLGEQMTERGVGNGISMLILAGIVAGLPGAVGRTVEAVNTGEMSGPFALLLVILIVGVTAFCVYVERAQRRITVNYAKRQVGRRMYAGQSTHLPFKLNMSGVIPPIFASSLLLFPATVASFGGTGDSAVASVLQRVAAALGYGQPLHLVLYAGLILFFCFFYTALVFNARDTADNLKKQGAFIPGIRPGQQTGDYIDKVLTRLTLWGAIYVTSVCLLPEILISSQGVPFQFGGTSLLIVVVVVMDFIAQLQAHMMSHHYPGLLKKANLLGYGRSGAPQG